MTTAQLALTFSMGILMVLGGSVGYLKKGSAVSLIAGSLTGGWYLYAAHLLTINQKDDALFHAKLVSVLVTCVFLLRYYSGGKAMALIIATLSAATGLTLQLLPDF
jgi:uncharacterized membrane protein (UPF0136 family)